MKFITVKQLKDSLDKCDDGLLVLYQGPLRGFNNVSAVKQLVNPRTQQPAFIVLTGAPCDSTTLALTQLAREGE